MTRNRARARTSQPAPARFTFPTQSGTVIDIPSLHRTRLRVLRDLQSCGDALTIDDILTLADTDEAREAMLDLDVAELTRFFRAWQRQAERAGTAPKA